MLIRADYLKVVLGRFNSIIPNDEKNLLLLPGIGKYTASAILSIAYNKSYPAIDGNLKRVISRLYMIGDRKNIKHPFDKTGKTKFWSFDITLKSGAWASVGCTDWSEKLTKEKRWKDALDIGVNSVEYTEFLRDHY